MARSTLQRMLGLDVGARRIGVAVSEGRIAVPLTIIEHENRAADLAHVSELAAEHGATTIVVGVPLNSARGDTQQSRLIRRFGAQLEQSVDLPVVYHDESYSTVAVEPVPAKRPRGKRPKTRLDDLAAAVILQSYIDAQEPPS